jgi:hypothetical protein
VEDCLVAEVDPEVEESRLKELDQAVVVVSMM